MILARPNATATTAFGAACGELFLAGAELVIDAKFRASRFGQFMLRQAGGYDPQYYTKEEAKSASTLAAAKFASASMATFSFMKAVAPAFDSHAVQTMPRIGDVIDPKYALMVGTAGFVWWAISKLDTAVIHAMRARRTAMLVAQKNAKLQNDGSLSVNKWGLMFRIGISAASLGITLPALLVTTSETTINQKIRDKLNHENASILTQQQGRLDELDGNISKLRARLAELQGTLVNLQNPGAAASDIQRKRIEALQAQLQDAARKKSEQDAQMAELEKKRDEAQARMRQEEMGTRGSVAGKKSKYMAAEADYEDTLRAMATVRAGMDRRGSEEKTAQAELDKINTSIARATEDGKEDIANRKDDIRRQIEDVRKDLQKQQTVRESLADIEGQASRDPSYKKFNPDMAEQVSAYIQYMRNDANVMEWSRAAFMSLMIVCLELGVFAMAASRPVNAGEMRGYLANALKSREAQEAYASVMANMDDAADTKAWDRKKRRIEMSDMAMFEEVLTEMEKDPNLRARIQREILHGFEQLRPSGAVPLTTLGNSAMAGSRRTDPVYGAPVRRATIN